MNDRPTDVFLWCRYDVAGASLPMLFSVTYARPGDRDPFPVTQYAKDNANPARTVLPMVRECSSEESPPGQLLPTGLKVYGLLRLPCEVLDVHTPGDLFLWHTRTTIANAVHLMQRLAGTLGWRVEVRPGDRLTGPTLGDFQRRYDLTVEPKRGPDLFGITVEDLAALIGEDEHGDGNPGRPDPVRCDPVGGALDPSSPATAAAVNPRMRGAGSRWRPVRE